VCAANLLIVAIYFRLPAVWDENFLLNEERIRHNEVISKETIKNSKIFRHVTPSVFSFFRLRNRIGKNRTIYWREPENRQTKFQKFFTNRFLRVESIGTIISRWPIFGADDLKNIVWFIGKEGTGI